MDFASLVYGMTTLGFIPLILDFANTELFLSLRSPVCFELVLSVYGFTWLGSPLLVLDHVHFEFLPFSQSLA